MSDRSCLQLLVYAVDDQDRDAVLEAIAEHDLHPDWDGDPSPTTLDLGTCYGAHEMPLGSSRELARTLQENAPSAVFELWQDPHPVADGDYIAHVPEVGTYIAGCDAQGAPHVSVPALIAHLSDLPDDVTVREWLSGANGGFFGSAILAALQQHKDALQAPAAA